MNLFKQRKNKRFNYVSRLSEKPEDDLKSQWNSIREKGKHEGGASSRLILLLVVLGMIIAVWLLLNYYEIS